MFCGQCLAFWRAVETEISNSDSLRIRDDLPGGLQIRWPRYSAIIHNSLAQLQQAAEKRCHICFCIFHYRQAYNIHGVLVEGLELEAGLDPEVILVLDSSDGTDSRLCAEYRCRAGTERAGEVVAKLTVGIFDGLLADEMTGITLQRCSELDSSGTGSAAAFELASFWLQRCLSTHEKCSKAQLMANFMPTRLLDVGNGKVRLVETVKETIPDAERRYFALSHCWGTTRIITTINDNLKRHLEDIPFKALSQTFQDAVSATRQLSFRYLWIDSLCIIQDSKSDWEQEAAQMCDIYRNATLTLAAAHASGGEEGCFSDNIEGLRYLPLVVELTLRTPDRKTFRCRPVFEGRGRGVPNELYLYVGPALYGRAWVFQEQILSLRSLSFDGPKLRWTCLENDGSMMVILNDQFMESSFYAGMKKCITNRRDLFADREDYNHWYEAVHEYTHRGMTVPSDRLFALAGIAEAISRTTKAQYCAGLWVEDLFQGLLWYIPHVDMAPTAFARGAFDLKRNKHVRHEKPLAPSWSWASVTVPVTYPALGQRNGSGSLLPMSHMRINASHSIPSIHSNAITATGHTRVAYINSVYPESISDAHECAPGMVLWNKVGERGKRFHFTFSDHTFQPSSFFLFSAKPCSHDSEWRFVPGEWCPDEVLDPSTPVTFLAIAQRHDLPDGSIAVHTISLVPTGNSSDEYRRVGYAVWNSCAWYGYLCGEAAEEYGSGLDLRWIQDRKGTAAHCHDFVMEGPPDMRAYHGGDQVETRTLNIL